MLSKFMHFIFKWVEKSKIMQDLRDENRTNRVAGRIGAKPPSQRRGRIRRRETKEGGGRRGGGGGGAGGGHRRCFAL